MQQLLLHACNLLPLAIEMQLHLQGLRVAARQLQLQARIVRFQYGDSSLELRLCNAVSSPALNQLRLHLLQLVSLHFLMRPVHLRRHSCAPAPWPMHPLLLQQLPLLFLLRVTLSLPRLRLNGKWPLSLHAGELVLLLLLLLLLLLVSGERVVAVDAASKNHRTFRN